jgi:hypothetical protein
MENALMGDGLGRRRRRRRKSSGSKARKGCSAAGVKANGRLRKGYRWAKGRTSCAVPARRRRRK